MNGIRHRIALCTAMTIVALGWSAAPCPAGEIDPLRLVAPAHASQPAVGLYSERTIVAGIEVDRDGARVLAYTVKPRPFIREVDQRPVVSYDERQKMQVEVVLHGPDNSRYTQRVDAGLVCLEHGPDSESHRAGDTIRKHRDSFIVELPELPGFESVEVAVQRVERGTTRRERLSLEPLTAERFTPAGTAHEYASLAFARPGEPAPRAASMASTVQWPEQFGDPDLYLVYGDESEADRRLNIVIVPDGYTYAEKAQMELHALITVSNFLAKSPHKEHAPLLNFILVYAYSIESGTDQCDCGITVDTAMGTVFKDWNPNCGALDNRCLTYGAECDADGTANIVAAELRAPGHDKTVLMVNTERYGGCGVGSRATFAAGHSAAVPLAIHEMGHTWGNLADEYGGDGCGASSGGPNTSTNPVQGKWPEWIDDLGPPVEGAHYHDQCVYRPELRCTMRGMWDVFCAVCEQQYSLVTYGHPRVSPTAPIAAITPAGDFDALVTAPVDFAVDTRVSASPATHEISWTVDGPGTGGATVVATGGDAYTHVFDQTGQFTMTVQVTADTNFVKPARYGANRKSRSWAVNVIAAPPEVSAPGATEPLRFADSQTLTWEDLSGNGLIRYNLYRGDLPPGGGALGDCFRGGLGTPHTIVNDNPAPNSGWFFLVAARNTVAEGTLGQSSLGGDRTSLTPCH